MTTLEPFHPNHRDRAGDLPDGFNDLPEHDRARLIAERTRLLHVYGAGEQHDDVVIVGNRNGLIVLRDAIDEALESGRGETSAMVSDGEGFGVVVKLNTAAWTSPAWETMRTPYIDPVARGEPDPAWQARQEITNLRQALRAANTMLVKRGVKPVEEPR